MRRKNTPIQAVLEWEKLRLNPGSAEVTYNGNLLNLTPKEYLLLELFLRNSNIVFSRSEILDHLWPMEEAPKEDTVTAHIKGLRQKLTKAGAPNYLIETVYGLGYRLKEIANSKVNSSDKAQNKPNNKQINKQQKTKEALTKAWEKLKVENIQRIAILEQAVSELRDKAQQVAHKFAGGLGTFGFSEGSHLARKIEEIFKSEVNLGRTQGIYLTELVKFLKLEIQQPAFNSDCKAVHCDEYSVMLVVNDDVKLARSIVKSAVASGINIELVQNLFAAKEALNKPQVDAVLVNSSLDKTTEESLSQLS